MEPLDQVEQVNTDEGEILVRANPSTRRKQGGIWRCRRFITLNYHRLLVTRKEAEIMSSDPNLEFIEDDGREEAISDEDTERALDPRATAKSGPTLVEQMMRSGKDEDDEPDEDPDKDKEGDDEPDNEIDRLLGKQDKAPTRRKPSKTKEGDKTIPVPAGHAPAPDAETPDSGDDKPAEGDDKKDDDDDLPLD